MIDLKLEEARLEALRASLKRIASDRGRVALGNTANAILICKEEDTRLQIATTQFLITRQEDETEALRNLSPPTIMCGTCEGLKFILVHRGNHSAESKRVPCPDCNEDDGTRGGGH